jgi:ribosome modulation factor
LPSSGPRFTSPDDPELEDAYRRGRTAGQQGRPVPDEPVYEDDEKQAAWLNGYIRGKTMSG